MDFNVGKERESFPTYNLFPSFCCCETKHSPPFLFIYQSIKIVKIDIRLTINFKFRSIESHDNPILKLSNYRIVKPSTARRQISLQKLASFCTLNALYAIAYNENVKTTCVRSYDLCFTNAAFCHIITR